jgi:hypothetical protein
MFVLRLAFLQYTAMKWVKLLTDYCYENIPYWNNNECKLSLTIVSKILWMYILDDQKIEVYKNTFLTRVSFEIS